MTQTVITTVINQLNNPDLQDLEHTEIPDPTKSATLGDNDLKNFLAISDLSTKLELQFAQTIHEIQGRMSTLYGQRLTHANDPLGVELLCRAIGYEINRLSIEPVLTSGMLSILEQFLSADLDKYYGAIVAFLTEHRIEPWVQESAQEPAAEPWGAVEAPGVAWDIFTIERVLNKTDPDALVEAQMHGSDMPDIDLNLLQDPESPDPQDLATASSNHPGSPGSLPAEQDPDLAPPDPDHASRIDATNADKVIPPAIAAALRAARAQSRKKDP